jgi:hypothetical protein
VSTASCVHVLFGEVSTPEKCAGASNGIIAAVVQIFDAKLPRITAFEWFSGRPLVSRALAPSHLLQTLGLLQLGHDLPALTE